MIVLKIDRAEKKLGSPICPAGEVLHARSHVLRHVTCCNLHADKLSAPHARTPQGSDVRRVIRPTRRIRFVIRDTDNEPTQVTAGWQAEYDAWTRRDLSARNYVYIWADGVYLQARMEENAECMLVWPRTFLHPEKAAEWPSYSAAASASALPSYVPVSSSNHIPIPPS